MATAGTFKRADGRFAWHLIASNGNIICGDQSQGYENENDAKHMMYQVLNGRYADALENFPASEETFPPKQTEDVDGLGGDQGFKVPDAT